MPATQKNTEHVSCVCVYVRRYGSRYDSQMRICIKKRILICVCTDHERTRKCVCVLSMRECVLCSSSKQTACSVSGTMR